MKLTVKEITALVHGTCRGNAEAVVSGVAGLEEASNSDLSFLRDAKNAKAVRAFAATKAAAVIVPKGFDKNGATVIEVDNPIAAFSEILNYVAKESSVWAPGVHASAYVSKTARIGKNVYIGPFCVVEDNAEVGDGARLQAQVYVGRGSKIGADTVIYPQVVFRENIQIGARCIFHSGTMVGSDGFGFYFDKGKHNKIPQVGNVIIEDDVEVGAGCAIDRATTGSTIIRKGTKIDNLVQIAHNVDVGAHSIIVAQVGIAGSSKLGQGVILAGQVGVADHVNIGDGAQVGAQSGIKDDVKPGEVLFGSPAQPIQDALRQTLLLRRLPELFQDVKKLKDGKK